MKRFRNLRPNECHWIAKDEPNPRCCGKKTTKRSAWCAKHYKIVYRPLVPLLKKVVPL